jgi:D-alanyl-D-alanine dipeptidase
MEKWQAIPISECGEPLVVVSGPRLHARPIYLERGYGSAPREIWLRRGAATRLAEAAAALPEGLRLVLWDGWRPLGLQQELYHRYRDEIAAAEGLSGAELELETQVFVTKPSADPASPSPHLTGGAIDLTLGDAGGEVLEMGGDFDELGPRSRTDYYERPHPAAAAELELRERRRLLCSVMAAAGFSNYPAEWWHFDFGNQFHCHRVGGVACYGLAPEPASA